jgi:hypothetical protein
LEVRITALQQTVRSLEETNRRLLWKREGGGSVKPSADQMQTALLTINHKQSDLVGKHMLEYSNITELSLKHTQLVQAYHELESQIESSHQDNVQQNEIMKQVQSFKTQLKTLVEARERSKREIRTLIQERDALQTALSNKDRRYLLNAHMSTINPPIAQDSTPPQITDVSRRPDFKAQIEQLKRNLSSTQDAFEAYKKNRVASDQENTKELRVARAEANEKVRDLTVAERDLEISHERVQELKGALTNAKVDAREEKAKHARTFENLLAQQAVAHKMSNAREKDQIDLGQLRAQVHCQTNYTHMSFVCCFYVIYV